VVLPAERDSGGKAEPNAGRNCGLEDPNAHLTHMSFSAALLPPPNLSSRSHRM
jgi:hypothetical protein